jgi:phenylalanine ammonia-lyase
MNKKDAIRKLEKEAHRFEPDQKYIVRALQPEDAWGVAQCFFAVYGAEYPFEVYYIPKRLLEENRRKNVYSIVAKAENGDIIGYGALYRSSAYYSRLYEIGQYIVVPEYHNSRAAFKIQEYIVNNVIPAADVDEFFGESVCHHVVSQKFGAFSGAKEAAIEIGLMPWEVYKNEDFPHERISALLQFNTVKDKAYDVYVPNEYAEVLEYIISGLGVERNVIHSEAEIPSGLTTRISTQFFEFAQVVRFNVQTVGTDFPEALETAMNLAQSRGMQVTQFFVNLAEPWSGRALSRIRQQGFFLGGFLPRWFDTDGLLMQRVLTLPNFDAIRLYSERAHKILDFIRQDLEGNVAGVMPPAAPEVFPEERESALIKAAAINNVILSGAGLTIQEVVAVAKHGATVALTDNPEVLERVGASADFIRWGVDTGEPIYGVNTGFGGMADKSIGKGELEALQANLIRFLKSGAGKYLSTENVRAAMLLRANSHMRGASGIRPELISRLVTFLNRRVHPRVRDLGSIGASGDLVPLATITGALIGADASFEVEFQGEHLDCLNALQKIGLEPFCLGPKEGLGMVNGTSVMTAVAANCLYEARHLIALAFGFHALVFQALHASNQSFHPFIHQAKPHPGQINAAAIMVKLLQGSRLCRNELDGHHAAQGQQPIQDRYSLRCLPQYLGPILDGWRAAVAAVETEMNSANDNPLIDGKNCISYHSGNFLGEYIGVWMDHLRYYLGLLAKHVDTQIALLVTPEFNNGLPASLVGNSGRTVNMGLKGLQIAANSIMPLLSFYGNSIADRYPTHAEQFNQNINSQGFNSALLAEKSVDFLRSYLAMALIFGVQAVELRTYLQEGNYDPRPRLSPLTLPLYEAVRTTLATPPNKKKPLIFNDDEQSLELFIATLTGNIVAEGSLIEAGLPVTALL